MKRVPANQENDQENILEMSSLSSWADSLYHILYLIGMRIIRYTKRTRRWTKIRLLHFKWYVRRKLSDIQEIPHTIQFLRQFRLQVSLPIKETKTNFQKYKLGRLMAKQMGEVIPRNLSISWALAPMEKPLTLLVNYLLPILGMLIFALIIQNFNQATYALRVEYNGEFSGYVLNESELETAVSQVRERMINENYGIEHMASYTLEAIDAEQLTNKDILVNNLIEASGSEIQEATGLYVDNKFIGAVENGDQLLNDLKSMKDKERSGQDEDTIVSFVQNVKVSKGLYPLSSIQQPEDINQQLTSVVKGQRTITIEQGDSPWTISQDVGVPVDTLIELNPDVSKNMLVGEPFLVSVDQLFLQKKVEKTVVEEQELAFTIEKDVDKNKSSTYSEVVQKGEKGLAKVTSLITIVDGYETDRTIVDRKTVKEPVSEKVVVGSLVASAYNFDTDSFGGTNQGGYIWPVNGGYISCPIWGYAGHTGTDIAAPSGTAIYAAKAGTVAFSGWSRSYGYNVVINHSDGSKTRYAHCSKLAAYVGQSVSQGQQIAYVGRTGNATGNHCHFEIISASGYKDARNYIGYSR